MSEKNAADRWIYATLAADATLTALIGGAVTPKIYSDLAPQTTPPVAMPYVIFTMMSAVDLRTVGIYRVWANCLYQIKGYAESNSYSGTLKTIADRIDAVLDAKFGSNVDGIVYACVRERLFAQTDPPVDGRVFRALGGFYRLYAR